MPLGRSVQISPRAQREPGLRIRPAIVQSRIQLAEPAASRAITPAL
jgi:hypothetical protein